MKNIWKWILGILVALVVLFALPFGLGMLMPRYGFSGYTGWGCCGGWGMMPFGHGGWGMMPFGFFGWLFPLAFLILLILGIVWLVNAVSGTKSASLTCPQCGKPIQADWKACPYCGHSLSS